MWDGTSGNKWCDIMIGTFIYIILCGVRRWVWNGLGQVDRSLYSCSFHWGLLYPFLYVCWFLCILCCMVEFGVTYLLCWCTYYTDIIHPQLFGWLTRYPANLDGIHAFDFLLKMLWKISETVSTIWASWYGRSPAEHTPSMHIGTVQSSTSFEMRRTLNVMWTFVTIRHWIWRIWRNIFSSCSQLPVDWIMYEKD